MKTLGLFFAFFLLALGAKAQDEVPTFEQFKEAFAPIELPLHFGNEATYPLLPMYPSMPQAICEPVFADAIGIVSAEGDVFIPCERVRPIGRVDLSETHSIIIMAILDESRYDGKTFIEAKVTAGIIYLDPADGTSFTSDWDAEIGIYQDARGAIAQKLQTFSISEDGLIETQDQNGKVLNQYQIAKDGTVKQLK